MPYINSHQGKLIMAHLKKGPMIRAYLVWKWSCHPIKLASKFGWFLSTIKHWNLENSNQISVKTQVLWVSFCFRNLLNFTIPAVLGIFHLLFKGQVELRHVLRKPFMLKHLEVCQFLSKNWKTPGFKGQSVTNRNLDCIAFTPFIASICSLRKTPCCP